MGLGPCLDPFLEEIFGQGKGRREGGGVPCSQGFSGKGTEFLAHTPHRGGRGRETRQQDLEQTRGQGKGRKHTPAPILSAGITWMWSTGLASSSVQGSWGWLSGRAHLPPSACMAGGLAAGTAPLSIGLCPLQKGSWRWEGVPAPPAQHLCQLHLPASRESLRLSLFHFH